MARQKRPENETEEEMMIRRAKERVANKSTRNEKVSWDRKMDNMVTLLTAIDPIEEQIIELMAKKIPIYDEIQALRQIMIKECTHPITHLVHKGDHVICKFCDRKFNVME